MRVTIFGGTGFVGRRLAWRLGSAGHHLILVARHGDRAAWRQGLPGSRVFVGDVTKAQTLPEAVRGAEVVVNLVGAVAMPSVEAYFDLHECGARRVAEAARQAGASRLIQISALGVRSDAPSAADRSKAAGERAAREAFPGARIVRPSLVFGEGDHLLSRFASLSHRSLVVPAFGAATRVQPVHVDDLVEALVRLAEGTASEPAVLEVGGPETYRLREVVQLLFASLGRRRWVVPVPYALAVPAAAMLERLPRAPITREQVALLKTDKVVLKGRAGLSELGIQPRSLEDWLGAESRQYEVGAAG